MNRALSRRIRGWIVKIRLPFRGSRIAGGTVLHLDKKALVQFGESVVVRGHGNILIEDGGTMYMGSHSGIMQGAEIVIGANAHLSVGASAYIGAYCNIRCGFSIIIGDGARLAQFVTLIDSNYDFRYRNVPIGGAVKGQLTIGPGAWLGAQVVVLPDITIGEGAVVGAGSVVTKDVAPFMVVAGNPAHIIGRRE